MEVNMKVFNLLMIGFFENDNFNGTGTLLKSDSIVIKGEWKNGVQIENFILNIDN